MRLYIAEKPSMGAEIAKCLPGPLRRHDGYLETAGGVVTWGFGHILRQAEPEEYDGRYKRWREEDLPIVPERWQLLVDESCRKQFGIVKELIGRADEIVHAGDPDREGQLLIDEVLDFVGNTKPVKRILLNALDEKSIREANADLRDNRDFLPLKQSALARARADWLIGMNLSRAYTLAARRAGHNTVLPIGRVKTPTLSLVVRRERELKNFQPVDYYALKAEFEHENGRFTAVWKMKEDQPGLDSEGRLTDRAVAEAKLAELAELPHEGKISSYQKTKKQEPQRLPFALSSLQVLAGKRFGYEPQLVLDTAQQLYERKLTTYPRSDCEYLPLNQLPAAKTIMANLTGIDDDQLAGWAGGADMKLKSRAWNDKKITAHHAIIPTTVKVRLEALTPVQRNIYFLIAQAYIAQFYPVHVYDQTKVGVTYKGELFTASGRTVRDMGWKQLYAGKAGGAPAGDGEEKDEEENGSLPQMKKGDGVSWQEGSLSEKATKPPLRFTAATLLAAMKEIHKYVKDPEAKKRLKDVYGIGTEATRATIIDDLIKRQFLRPEGKKKYLVPSPSAFMLVDALPDEMTYPDSTAVWEDALHSMAQGEGSLEEFLRAQVEFTRLLCGKAGSVKIEREGEFPCPRCGKGVLTRKHGRNGDFWGCTNFPHCRMTCNDKEGKPDLAAKRYEPAPYFRAETPRSFSARGENAAGKGYQASPFLSPEEMAEFTASYQPTLSAQQLIARQAQAGGGRKPAVSAGPLEKQAPPKTPGGYLCPHCKEGSLHRVRGRNGYFWSCSSYPSCTATYDDDNGRPVLY